MRTFVLAFTLLAAACAAPSPRITATALAAADAATSLLVGQAITLERAEAAAPDGMDPLVRIALRHADGRVLRFEEANHTPHDVMAQSPGGPLAQVMGLFGEEQPVLYRATGVEGGAFLCGPDGPVTIGVHETPDGVMQIVAMRQAFAFETRPDGVTQALPFSPDQVCARLRFRRQ